MDLGPPPRAGLTGNGPFSIAWNQNTRSRNENGNPISALRASTHQSLPGRLGGCGGRRDRLALHGLGGEVRREGPPQRNSALQCWHDGGDAGLRGTGEPLHVGLGEVRLIGADLANGFLLEHDAGEGDEILTTDADRLDVLLDLCPRSRIQVRPGETLLLGGQLELQDVIVLGESLQQPVATHEERRTLESQCDAGALAGFVPGWIVELPMESGVGADKRDGQVIAKHFLARRDRVTSALIKQPSRFGDGAFERKIRLKLEMLSEWETRASRAREAVC